MMTIDEEVAHVLSFLKHPAGFDVGMHGSLCIRAISEDSPPTHWAVDWEENLDGSRISMEREFPNDLVGAVQFFVEKRRYMCAGLDFEKMFWEETPEG